MTTARDIINLAFKEAGILGVGQTLLAEDINDGFTLLQRMANQWQKRRWLVPSLFDISITGNNSKSYTVGPGKDFNMPRPDKIQAAYVVQNNTGSTTPISLPLFPIFSYEDYARLAVKNLPSLPDHFFYDAANPFGNIYFWPIPDQTYDLHLIVKSNIGFNTTITDGVIVNGGSGYADGNYPAVPLTSVASGVGPQVGNGTGATANITVAGGIITTVVIQNGGEDFNINDKLSCSNALLGGTGSGFLWKVTNVTSNLDSDMDMPSEYEEALHYNLALRVCSMYQIPPMASTGGLAKVALNTLRRSNVQVPGMSMPNGLRRGRAFNIYNPDGYGAY